MGLSFDINTFKSKFARNFPFLPIYSEETAYKKNDIVYEGDSDSFYKSLQSQNTEPLSDETAWLLLEDEKLDDYVLDSDIEYARLEAMEVANDEILEDLSFMYLVAFYLSYDLMLAESGANGTTKYPVEMQKVGSVMEKYNIPDWIEKDPNLSFYANNGFGLKYLSLIRAKIVGNVACVAGTTTPC